MDTPTQQQATFGSGCFWCSEATFSELRGVTEVVSGYSGGNLPSPTYEAVCSGTTGHAEVIQVTFDPRIITYEQLVQVFFLTHDPTTPNRQGHDVGSEYRSVIFTHNESQRVTAQHIKAGLERDHVFSAPIVTEILPFTTFYPAEAHHQHFYEKNPELAYCQAVINPKLATFRSTFSSLLRTATEK